MSRRATSPPYPADRQVTLSWDNPHKPLVYNYQYRYKAGDGAYGGWQAMPTLPKDTSYTVTGLTNDIKHTFQVQVRDTTPAVTTRLIHTSSYARLDGNNKVTLTWNRYIPSHSYWQYRQKTGTGDWGAWTSIQGSNNQTTSWQTGALLGGHDLRIPGAAGRPEHRVVLVEVHRGESGATATVTWTNPSERLRQRPPPPDRRQDGLQPP